MMRKLSFLLLASLLFAMQGCASTITKGADRRTQGAFIEDGTIEDTATERIKNKYADNVNSYNRKVLITGEVADDTVKADISRITGGVQNVSEIYSEFIVGPLTSLSSRSSDTLTTSNVMFRMRDSGKDFFRAERVKVVTEHDTVYMLGLVTHAEAEIAKEIASTSRGVKKVVPLFEYID